MSSICINVAAKVAVNRPAGRRLCTRARPQQTGKPTTVIIAAYHFRFERKLSPLRGAYMVYLLRHARLVRESARPRAWKPSELVGGTARRGLARCDQADLGLLHPRAARGRQRRRRKLIRNLSDFRAAIERIKGRYTRTAAGLTLLKFPHAKH